MLSKYCNYIETVIVIGTFERTNIAYKSLSTLKETINGQDVKVIVVDSSKDRPSFVNEFSNFFEFVFLPSTTSMASARNIGYLYAKQKYVFDWICFLEDDLLFEIHWYKSLISFAKDTKGKQSPHGLIYGCFTASPGAPKLGPETVFDSERECFSEAFGSRADQRLYPTNIYEFVAKEWDNDLLGISSCQTGKQSHRMLLNGFCSANIGSWDLCQFVPGEESTWQNSRDIGVPAFDKDFRKYQSILSKVKIKDNAEPSSLNSNYIIKNAEVNIINDNIVKLGFYTRIKYYIRKRLRNWLL